MRPVFRYILYIYLSIFAGYVNAQKLKNHFENISEKFHKLHIGINDIVQDQYGFMWFATDGGLYRYDGKEIKSYVHDVLDSMSLASPKVNDVAIDTSGQLWVSTNYGISVLDQKTGKFQRFAPFEEGKSTKGLNNINCLFIDSQNRIWSAGYGNLYLFDLNTHNFRIITQKDGSHEKFQIRNIAEDKNGKIWCATSEGLLTLGPQADYFEQVVLDIKLAGNWNNIYSIVLDAGGNLWLGSNTGLISYNPENGAKEIIELPIGLKDRAIQQILVGEGQELWLSFFNYGIAVYNLNSRNCMHFLNDENNMHSLHTNAVKSIQIDLFGNIWIGTLSGISKLTKHNRGFSFSPNVNGINQLANQTYRILKDQSGTMWVKTGAGIFVKKKSENFYQPVNLKTRSATHEFIDWIFEDYRGGIWIPVAGEGIYRKALDEEEFKLLDLDDIFKVTRVAKIIEDYNTPEKLWIGTIDGLCELDIKSQKTKWHLPNSQFSELNNRLSIFEQLGNEIWLYYTYNNSIGKLDKSNGLFEHYRPPDNQQYMLEGIIRDIAVTQDSNVWFATTYGLTRYNIHNKRFHIYTTHNGLAENILNSVIIDHNNKLWVTSDQYVSEFDYTTERFRNFDASAKINSFLGKSKFIDESGKIYFGGVNGIYAFHPDSIDHIKINPKIVLTDLKILNKPYTSEVNIEELRELTLNYKQNDIAFRFIGIQYNNPEAVVYRCQLVGYDTEWKDLGKLNIANYTNLNPGDYEFRVQAANENTPWGTEEINVKLTISPPFTETNWFRSLIALFIFLAGYFSYRIWSYNHQLKRQKQMAEEASEFRMQFLAHASHEIRTPMNAIVGLSGLINATPLNPKQKKYISAIEQASLNLLQIINELLDHTKLESGKFSFNEASFSLEQIVDQVDAMFQVLAKEKNLSLHFKLSEKLPKILKGDALRLTQILTNVIGNALKFTEKGSIDVVVAPLEQTKKHVKIEFIIKDTGLGIEADKLKSVFERFSQNQKGNASEGSGLGLYITKELIEGQGGEINVSSVINKGTTVWFMLPFVLDTKKESTVKTDAPQYQLSNLKILVVDDAPFNHLVINEMLKKSIHKLELFSADNGHQALEIFQQHELDLIILDAKMPGLSGLEVAKKIRESSEIPILGATAGAMPDQIQACLDSGMNDVITKPIDAAVLMAKIDLIMNRTL